MLFLKIFSYSFFPFFYRKKRGRKTCFSSTFKNYPNNLRNDFHLIKRTCNGPVKTKYLHKLSFIVFSVENILEVIGELHHNFSAICLSKADVSILIIRYNGEFLPLYLKDVPNLKVFETYGFLLVFRHKRPHKENQKRKNDYDCSHNLKSVIAITIKTIVSNTATMPIKAGL